jgi:hypothetical protein
VEPQLSVLVALQNELDELRAHRPVDWKFVAAIVLISAAGAGALVVDLIQGAFDLGLRGYLAAAIIAIPGAIAARYHLAWRREIRRLEARIERLSPASSRASARRRSERG